MYCEEKEEKHDSVPTEHGFGRVTSPKDAPARSVSVYRIRWLLKTEGQDYESRQITQRYPGVVSSALGVGASWKKSNRLCVGSSTEKFGTILWRLPIDESALGVGAILKSALWSDRRL